MNNKPIYELDKAILLNPENATNYINRGDAYYKKGNSDQAIADYDSAVRHCSNYGTNFIDSDLAHRGQEAVEAAIELLNSMIASPPESTADFYYTGVKLLLINDIRSAKMAFEMALKLGYEDLTKVKKHLENLENRK